MQGFLSTLRMWLQWAGGALLIAVATATGIQVVTRYLFSNPVVWGSELSRYSYVWLVFLTSPVIALDGRHLAVNLFTRREGDSLDRLISRFSDLAVAAVCVPLGLVGLNFSVSTWDLPSAGLRLPQGLFYGITSVGILLTGAVSLVRLTQPVASREDVDGLQKGN